MVEVETTLDEKFCSSCGVSSKQVDVVIETPTHDGGLLHICSNCILLILVGVFQFAGGSINPEKKCTTCGKPKTKCGDKYCPQMSDNCTRCNGTGLQTPDVPSQFNPIQCRLCHGTGQSPPQSTEKN